MQQQKLFKVHKKISVDESKLHELGVKSEF